jgi:protein-S-isoprenylcysteine O-methyltransferase Ste14
MIPLLSLWFLVAGYFVLVYFIIVERLLRRTESAKTFKAGGFDRRSTSIVSAGFGAGLLLPLVFDALGLFPFSIDIAEGLIGLVVMLLGLVLRVWAAAALGDYYSTTLLVTKDQKLVNSGPYARVRHPGYLGSILLWSGFGILSSNLVLAILFPVMFVVIYLYRISVEELMLGQELGEDYAEYRRRTQRLLPFLY